MICPGPAYGIAVTMLPYFDLVYATPEATFTTPFSRLAISVEGCSSVLFPAIFGHALSTRMLLLSETVTVEEVSKSGFIAEVLPRDTAEGIVLKKIEFWLSDLAYRSVLASRRLVRSPKFKKMLHDVNNAEMEVLAERRGSEDHRQALLRFQARKKAKKGAGSAKL
jgi:peroxisomal 3,2-trans-enoyl-CoA isomerase